jgi:eukaryotic-like serine/threonine-protein kinase
MLARSKLLHSDEVEALHKAWRDETRAGDGEVDQFRKFLVGRKCLTEYQAYMVQRGRADGFFLGMYKILDRIGKGQMGGVYKAVHTLGQLVALKILPASKAKNPQFLSRFQREARLLTQLVHPNVVRAFQLGQSNGIHFIVMEYLEGETLDEVLNRRKSLPWAEAVRLVHQAFGGLQHLHERRMVHRDMKPANLMLTPAAGKPDSTWNATVKILDIGLGRELFDESAPGGPIETQLTEEGAVLGTPDYLAPEQARDARSADIRADIYSLGCVLYHCLTGRPPFAGSNIMAQMLKHATEKPVPLASLVPDLPSGLPAVIDRMLAKQPGDRYPIPAAAAAALEPFLGNAGTAPKPAALVPEFKAWLESELHLEMPRNLPPLPATQPVKPSGSAAKPVVGASVPPLAKSAGTGSGGGGGIVGNPKVTRSDAPPRPVADEFDVELVAEPLPKPIPIPNPVPTLIPAAKANEARGLLEFDRRDWIMLATGAASVLAAVGVGYGLARLARKKPEEESGGD